MTIPEKIMHAVSILVFQEGRNQFTREEIRNKIGVEREEWDTNYSPIFQGMRADQPGGAPAVRAKYQGVFRQVAHGAHTLTDDGKRLLSEFKVTDHPPSFELYDLRITVAEIKGRSVCGLNVGDYFELTESSRLRIPPDKHFCIYALQSVLIFLPAHQRALDPADWMSKDVFIACPDPEERLIMKIERIARHRLNTDDLT